MKRIDVYKRQGHFIVLAGCEGGKIKVNDPFSVANTQKLWDFERLEGQIKGLWVFSLKQSIREIDFVN